MKHSTDFEVGDIVRLRGCHAVQRVTHVGDGVISTTYLKSDNCYYDRRATDFELTTTNPRPKEDHMKTLFQTKTDPIRYGHFLAENSDGRMVLVMSEGGYEDFDPKDLDEVVPYTIAVQNADGKTIHYAAPKGLFEKGDLLVKGCKLFHVIDVDTKSKGAQKASKDFRKVATVPT